MQTARLLDDLYYQWLSSVDHSTLMSWTGSFVLSCSGDTSAEVGQGLSAVAIFFTTDAIVKGFSTCTNYLFFTVSAPTQMVPFALPHFQRWNWRRVGQSTVSIMYILHMPLKNLGIVSIGLCFILTLRSVHRYVPLPLWRFPRIYGIHSPSHHFCNKSQIGVRSKTRFFWFPK